MWSVWSESVDIYLGQGVTMLKIPHQEAQRIQHPVTWPLERVLAQLAEVLSQGGTQHRLQRRTLQITLSGALCPATGFKAPQEVRRWNELRQIAHASAAATWGVEADQIVCDMDAGGRGITASVGTVWMQTLQRWAAGHHWRIASLRPLWAVATQSPRARQTDALGLLIHEPDAITAIADGAHGEAIASTLAGDYGQASGQALVRRWLVGLGLREDGLLHLNFGIRAQTAMPLGLKAWAAYWSTSAETP
ncbi:MAG: hypothetical protein A3F78_11935 [Burkholderiales bacterium RIFCSPLOWO2_12_FULL_61_40]|nr:MAG: hypothetical protein A3F78_11935 [Burkholderiales bacterium RIFCSPLOWO2_12_FULL_61_40]